MRKVAIILSLVVVLAGCGNTKNGREAWTGGDKPKASAVPEVLEGIRGVLRALTGR